MYFSRWKNNCSSPRREISLGKHDPSYPHNAIEFVLKYANLELSQVDQIVFLKTVFKI